MKKFNAEKIYLINLQHFKLSHFWTIPYIKWWFKQCTLYEINSSYSFKCILSKLCEYVTYEMYMK